MFGTQPMTTERWCGLLKQKAALGFGGMPSMKRQWQKFLGTHNGRANMIKRPYGKIYKGNTIPYGTLAGVSQELRSAYYAHGYQHDEDMPELPCPPQEDEECVDLEEGVYKKDVARLIEEALDDVTPRQKKVLCLRFGIGVTQEYTLEEIGAVFGVRVLRREIVQHLMRNT